MSEIIFHADDPWGDGADLHSRVQTALQGYVGEIMSDRTLYRINLELTNICTMIGRIKPITATVDSADSSVIHIQY